MVGHALGERLVDLGHDVMMGSRSAHNAKAQAWLQAVGGRGRAGTFADAARHGETIVNCTPGAVSLEVLRSVERRDLTGKVLIDIANPLDFSSGSLAIRTAAATLSPGSWRLRHSRRQTRSIIDLGGISSARATEQLMPIWMNLYRRFGTTDFNFKVVRS